MGNFWFIVGFIVSSTVSSMLLATIIMGLFSLFVAENKVGTVVLITALSVLLSSFLAISQILGEQLGWEMVPTVSVGALCVLTSVLLMRTPTKEE